MTRWLCGWMCVALVVASSSILTARAASAQSPAPVAGSPVTQPDVFLVAVPRRDEAEIDADLRAADEEFLDAREAENMATALRTDAQASITAKKTQISDNKRQRDAARKAGNTTEATTLDAQRRAFEREQDLLEQRAGLRAAEIDLARKQGELATLRKRTLEFEKSLLAKRRELDAAELGTPTAAATQRVILDLEQQTLTSRLQEAEKRIDVASREKSVAASLLKLVEAQRRLMVSD
jgi:hypothetical protein